MLHTERMKPVLIVVREHVRAGASGSGGLKVDRRPGIPERQHLQAGSSLQIHVLNTQFYTGWMDGWRATQGDVTLAHVCMKTSKSRNLL